ncbi:MAG: D-alanyl-D-alanine carboxypeptidase family protein [Patescibacteria group bacterium]
MLLAFLISLLALQQNIVSPAISQPAIVNEAIKFEEIKNFPQSLGIKITAKSALVVDAETDRILFQKNSQQVLPIASLTKLMTALIILDSKPNWQKEVEYLADDFVSTELGQSKLEPAQLKFEVGEKIKIKDLFAATLIKSANNAVKALVRQFGNQIFVEEMNRKAKEIGMTRTVFIEPTGIDFKNVSTAEDLAKLIKFISEKTEIAKLSTTKIYKFSTRDKNGQNKFYQIKNINKLLDSFIKIKMAKTGYLDEAGYCFAGLVEYNKKKLIIILLGSQSEKERWQEVKGLAWWVTIN